MLYKLSILWSDSGDPFSVQKSWRSEGKTQMFHKQVSINQDFLQLWFVTYLMHSKCIVASVCLYTVHSPVSIDMLRLNMFLSKKQTLFVCLANEYRCSLVIKM